MPSIELLYFGIHGRALLTRMLLKLGDVEFTDTKLTREEFGEMKPSLPLGQVPVLKVDGVMYCQTNAIVAYAASLAGLSKLSDIEELKSNMVCVTITEMVDQTSKPAFMAMMAVPEAEKEKRSETFYGMAKKNAPDQIKKLEKILKHLSTNDSVVDGKMTLADLAIMNVYIMYTDAKMDMADIFNTGAPTAAKIVAKMMKNEKVAAMTTEAQAVPFLPF